MDIPDDDMDYADDIEPMSIATLMKLNQLALELDVVKADIADLGADLARAKAEELRLEQDTIPDILLNLGHSNPVDLPCGKKVQAVNVIKPSITQPNQAAAFKWLDENGHGGIIKREVTVAFGKEREQDALELAHKLRDDKYPVKFGGSIHSGTLKKFVRERLEEGVTLPKAISVHRFTIAKLS